jgi:glutamate N-acetyltransferase/amino-acid N-acetyltransferase
MARERHITLPGGFTAAATCCGIKPSGKSDLAILAGEKPLATAVMTTTNQIVGEPVKFIRQVLPKGFGRTRGMVINSGNSNVCTGRAGLADAKAMATRTAKHLGAEAGDILVASTGVIGHRLPMAKIRSGIDAACEQLDRTQDDAVARAILTTDLRAKSAVVQTRLGGKTVTLSGIAKGSGMIAPSLATMIAVITTDAAVAPRTLHKALREAAGVTFDAVTVDSDTSTSDTVAVFASGEAGNKPVTASQPAFRTFLSGLKEVCGELARAIVADGEGATRVVKIVVTNARSDSEAKLAAKSVADSPLVKTAIHGGDPNWGRIAMALGKSRATVVAEKLSIKLGRQTVFSRGAGRRFDVKAAEAHLGGEEVVITCNLNLGKGTYTAWTCDLSREYIAINADYTT